MMISIEIPHWIGNNNFSNYNGNGSVVCVYKNIVQCLYNIGRPKMFERHWYYSNRIPNSAGILNKFTRQFLIMNRFHIILDKSLCFYLRLLKWKYVELYILSFLWIFSFREMHHPKSVRWQCTILNCQSNRNVCLLTIENKWTNTKN